MNKLISTFIATTIVVSFISCGGGNKILDEPTLKDAEISHTYKIYSTAPIEMSMNVTSATSSSTISGDIIFNGVNTHTSVLNEDIAHEGTSSYEIKSISRFLSTFITLSALEVDDVKVTYEWQATINGKQVKSDKGTIILRGVQQTKVYQTEL